MVPFESLIMIFYSHSIATIADVRQYMNVTDTVADRQTSHNGIGRTNVQHRAAIK